MNKFNINQAVILAGGLGERLKPLTNDLPKPLAPINGIPFLDYLIESLLNVGINKILLLLGYKAEKIVERYSNIPYLNFEIEFSIGKTEFQTGKRVMHAYSQLHDKFLLMYGDNYWPIQFISMLEFWKTTNAGITTTVFSNKNGTGEYGTENNVRYNNKFQVEFYDKSRNTPNLNGVDIGYFLVDKKMLDPSIKENISFEEYFLPRMIAKKKLYAFVTDSQYYYLTDLNSLKNYEKYVRENNINFLKV